MSQIGNSISKMSVIIAECCSSDEPFKDIFSYMFSSDSICLFPRECNWLISKKTIAIKIMCKLSFEVYLLKVKRGCNDNKY